MVWKLLDMYCVLFCVWLLFLLIYRYGFDLYMVKIEYNILFEIKINRYLKF